MSKEKIRLYFDGSNKSFGYILEVLDGPILHTEDIPERFPHTNNVGEYLALLSGMYRALELGYTNLEAYGDSQLIIYQVLGRYGVKKKHLRELHEEVLETIRDFDSISFHWIPREKNKADAVSRPSVEAG